MAVEPVSAARSLGMQPDTEPKPAPKVRNDPRYLKNLREVARSQRNARVIGGTPVVGEFEDCVAVGDDNQFACTGTLIAPDVVLTAGHCQAFHTRVFVGTDVTKQGRIFRIRKHVPHPKFDSRTMVNDLTILFLDKKVTGVTPRKVAPKGLIDNATTARVVGFGSTRLDGMGFLSAKLAADVPIVSPSCGGTVNGETDEDFYGCHLSKELIAGKPMLHFDTCKGDSGGPLYVQNPNGDWLLAGATSRGTDISSTMCGDGGTYVRVDAYAAVDQVRPRRRQARSASQTQRQNEGEGRAQGRSQIQAEGEGQDRKQAQAEGQGQEERQRPVRSARSSCLSAASAGASERRSAAGPDVADACDRFRQILERERSRPDDAALDLFPRCTAPRPALRSCARRKSRRSRAVAVAPRVHEDASAAVGLAELLRQVIGAPRDQQRADAVREAGDFTHPPCAFFL